MQDDQTSPSPRKSERVLLPRCHLARYLGTDYLICKYVKRQRIEMSQQYHHRRSRSESRCMMQQVKKMVIIPPSLSLQRSALKLSTRTWASMKPRIGTCQVLHRKERPTWDSLGLHCSTTAGHTNQESRKKGVARWGWSGPRMSPPLWCRVSWRERIISRVVVNDPLTLALGSWPPNMLELRPGNTVGTMASIAD